MAIIAWGGGADGTACCCEFGGVPRCFMFMFTTGPRLCGKASGRGRECVRSKRPHLLQSCRQIQGEIGGGDEAQMGATYHFAGCETGPPPGGGVGRTAVVTFPADTVAELRSGIVGVDDVVGLAGVWLGGDNGGPDRARHALRGHAVRGSRAVVRVAGHGAVGLVRVWGLAHGRRLYRVGVVGRGRLSDLYKTWRRQWVGTGSDGAWVAHRGGRGNGVALEGGCGERGRVMEGGNGGRGGVRVRHELILSRAVRTMAVGGLWVDGRSYIERRRCEPY